MLIELAVIAAVLFVVIVVAVGVWLDDEDPPEPGSLESEVR